MKTKLFPPNSRYSIDVKVLCDKMRPTEVGKTVTYQELSVAIGRDVQRGARPQMYAALRRLARDEGVFFDTVRGVGLVRQSNDDVASGGETVIAKTSRALHRSVARVSAPDPTTLSPGARLKQAGHQAIVATLQAVIRKAPQIEGAIESSGDVIPYGRVLDMIK